MFNINSYVHKTQVYSQNCSIIQSQIKIVRYNLTPNIFNISNIFRGFFFFLMVTFWYKILCTKILLLKAILYVSNSVLFLVSDMLAV